jgi:hypothetical protein
MKNNEHWKKYIDYMVLNKFKDTEWLKPVTLFENTPIEINTHLSYTEEEFNEKVKTDNSFKDRWVQ